MPLIIEILLGVLAGILVFAGGYWSARRYSDRTSKTFEFTKIRTTALVISALLVGVTIIAMMIMLVILRAVQEVGLTTDTIPVVLIFATGLIAIASASVGYLGGAMTRLTDDSGPPPWVGLLETAIKQQRKD